MDRLAASEISLPGLRARVVASCGSTNTELMQGELPASPVLLAAEAQTAGRGRRGRRWVSRPGGSITFSLAACVARPVRELASLSLVAGAAAAAALRALGAKQVALKWPNDLVVGPGKLGGILVETRSGGRGAAPLAVIGIGLNYLADPALAASLRRPVACLEQLVSPLPPRNRVIREIARSLLELLARFERGGLDAVRDEWLRLHAHAGRRLKVRLDDGRTVSGIASGLASDGGLELLTRSGLRAVRSGRIVGLPGAA